MTTGHWSPLQARISCLFLLFVSLFVSWCCVCFVHNRTKKKWAEVRNEGARRGEVMDEGWIGSDREKRMCVRVFFFLVEQTSRGAVGLDQRVGHPSSSSSSSSPLVVRSFLVSLARMSRLLFI